jgi:aminoglycoside phosphotransferase (APT) family kinase protein
MDADVPDPDSLELSFAAAIAHVPGYAPADSAVEIRRLAGGSVNRSYRISTPAGRFVMRLSATTDAWLAQDRSVERAVHRVAADAGIAPRIVHADDNDRWLITEYVAGRLWTDPEFSDPQALAALGNTLKRLHGLAPPAAGRCDLRNVLTGYVDRIQAGVAKAPLSAYLAQAQAAWQIAGATQRSAVIVHHDLHGSNLIESEQGLVLIDWECAAVADPLLDVACVLSYYETARPHAATLLRHAGLEDVTSAQLGASVWLFDLHTYLWYRERRLRIVPTGAELQAEQRLAFRLERGLQNA